MTIKELIEELKEIDKKYQDHEVILYHNGSADKWQIAEVGKENEWEDEKEIYITISQKGERMSDHLKTVGMVSALFGIMSGDDRESKVKFQKRFFETVQGLHFPEDWDILPIEEKERRLEGVQKIALEKEKE